MEEPGNSDYLQHGLHRVVGKEGVLMISLAKQPKRFEHSSKLLATVGIHPTLFQATDGQDPATSEEELNSACAKDGCSDRRFQALVHSHRRALLHAQQREKDWTAILEDDVVPAFSSDKWSSDFDAVWNALPPKAKLVRLGRCVMKHWKTSQLPSAVGMKLPTYAAAGKLRITQWTGFNDSYYAGGCTHAYMVHRSIIPDLLALFPCHTPLDACFEWSLFNPRGQEFLFNIDLQSTPDEAWTEAQANTGLLKNVMQFGILKQDWAALPNGITSSGLGLSWLHWEIALGPYLRERSSPMGRA